MNQNAKWILPTALTALLGIAFGLVLMISSTEEQPSCAVGGDSLSVDGAVANGVAGFSAEQVRNAAAIITAGKKVGASAQAQKIAVMTAIGESGLRVVDHGDSAGPDSRGLFQQRDNGAWGSYADRMDPEISATNFYKALFGVPGWQTMSPTQAAHATQHNADPNYYTRFWAPAVRLTAALTGNIQTVASTTNAAPAANYHLGKVTPALSALVDALAPRFNIQTVGGYRSSARDAAGHPSGRAADFMTTSKGQGDALAAFARGHAKELGVDYIMWRQRIWSLARAGEGWRTLADRGSPTANHMDHVHINVLPDAKPTAMAAVATNLGDPTCGTTASLMAGGAVVFPLPEGSGYRDNRNWHSTSALRASWHTGNDYSVACGTPVRAATAGKVIISTDQAWAGPQLVKISTGPKSVTTWYAHMQKVVVKNGDQVTAGQQIGNVGSLGNSTGCHLHFEVHTKNGPIYGPDNVDPVKWLAQNVGKELGIQMASSPTGGVQIKGVAGKAQPTAVVGAGRSGSDAQGGFRLATFNILGDNHTGGRGADQHPSWPNGAQRVPAAVRTMGEWGVDVAALQEVQTSQRSRIEAASGGGLSMWPRIGSGGDNRMVWRNSTFEFVTAAQFTIPYFNGRYTAMPVVLLRQKATGKMAWFVSVHNPAETARYHRQGKWRTIAIQRERAAVKELLATGHPVFLMGDLNARRPAFCGLAAGNMLRAANGGTGAPCKPPKRMEIDWIFGAGRIGFTGYNVDHSLRSKRISDHPIVLTQAYIG